jgi:hypothetical protein
VETLWQGSQDRRCSLQAQCAVINLGEVKNNSDGGFMEETKIGQALEAPKVRLCAKPGQRPTAGMVRLIHILINCQQSPASHPHKRCLLMLPTSPFARALRNAAPMLSRRFFDCRYCQTSASRLAKTSTRNAPAAIKSKTYSAWTVRRSASTLVWSNIAQPFQSQAKKASSFPETSSNTVAYWLLGSAASVFGIVVFGGWTRLTESG